METKLEMKLRQLMSNLEYEIRNGAEIPQSTVLLMSEIKQELLENDRQIETQLQVMETWRGM